jgi:hypothetical protein
VFKRRKLCSQEVLLPALERGDLFKAVPVMQEEVAKLKA